MASTSCNDEKMIRDILQDYEGDIDLTIETLIAMQQSLPEAQTEDFITNEDELLEFALMSSETSEFLGNKDKEDKKKDEEEEKEEEQQQHKTNAPSKVKPSSWKDQAPKSKAGARLPRKAAAK
jgi:pyruvate/oxaloacetate carboxyltransferase